MYMLIEGTQALVIDPHVDDEMLKVLCECKIDQVLILLTHEHADHIEGIHWLQENVKTWLLCQENCARYIAHPRKVKPAYIPFILELYDVEHGTNLREEFLSEYPLHTYVADETFAEEKSLEWGKHIVKLYHIPGHSTGSCLILIDGDIAFTGDSLLMEYPVITHFPEGNHKVYINETLPKMEKILKTDMRIFPGHGEPFEFKTVLTNGHIDVQLR